METCQGEIQPVLHVHGAHYLVPLVQLFGWQTFKRVGASITISRVYKLVLVLSIVIQLSLFFMVIAISLWLDQLCNGNIGRLENSSVYKPLLIVTLIVSPISHATRIIQ